MKVPVADHLARRAVRRFLRSSIRAAVVFGVVVCWPAGWGAWIARGQDPAAGAAPAPSVGSLPGVSGTSGTPWWSGASGSSGSSATLAPSSHSAAQAAPELGAAGADIAPPGSLRPSVLGDAGVLLLRNGETVEGIVTPAGDYYYVTVPNGQLRFRAAEVRMVCRDLEEAYWRQRGALRADDVMDRLRLAHWCLAHHMPGHAARELADAVESDPTHPGIDYLRRRLRAQLDAASGGNGADAPAEPLGASPEELDRFVAGLPRGAVESYVATIQPMLQNNCTAAGCHGPQSNSAFRLMRAPADQPASRRLTQRNLHAVSRWIDFEQPESSPLLAAARNAHGGGVAPVFGPRRRDQYDRLAEWVFELAGRPVGFVADRAATAGAAPVTPNPWLEPPGAATADGAPSTLDAAAHAPATRGTVTPARFDAISESSPVAGDSGVVPAGYFEPIDTRNGSRGAGSPKFGPARPQRVGEPTPRGTEAVGAGSDGKALPVGQHGRAGGGAVPRFLPADPFDPAIFNQRYFAPDASRGPK